MYVWEDSKPTDGGLVNIIPGQRSHIFLGDWHESGVNAEEQSRLWWSIEDWNTGAVCTCTCIISCAWAPAGSSPWQQLFTYFSPEQQVPGGIEIIKSAGSKERMGKKGMGRWGDHRETSAGEATVGVALLPDGAFLSDNNRPNRLLGFVEQICWFYVCVSVLTHLLD